MKPAASTLPATFLLCLLASACSPSPTRLAERAVETLSVASFYDACERLGVEHQELVADVVLQADTWAKRRTAVDYITDPVVLERVATECTDPNIVDVVDDRLEAAMSGAPLFGRRRRWQWIVPSPAGVQTDVRKVPSATWSGPGGWPEP
jgi:hypothetical protein